MRVTFLELLPWLGVAVLACVLLWQLISYLETRRRWRENQRKRKVK